MPDAHAHAELRPPAPHAARRSLRGLPWLFGDDVAREELGPLHDVLEERIASPGDVHPVPEWPLALHRHDTRREIVAAVGYVKLGVHLFVRTSRDAAYGFLGPVTFVSAAGDRPIGITWRLAHPRAGALSDRFASLAQG